VTIGKRAWLLGFLFVCWVVYGLSFFSVGFWGLFLFFAVWTFGMLHTSSSPLPSGDEGELFIFQVSVDNVLQAIHSPNNTTNLRAQGTFGDRLGGLP
jgi:hypothetical protein